MPAIAQEEDDANETIREKMDEFIQKRLNLSKSESEKFTPIFMRYFKEWRQTLRDNREDKLILKQKVAELQIRYRAEFRQILGEKRGNQVYQQQDAFIKMIRTERENRMKQRVNAPNKNLRPSLH